VEKINYRHFFVLIVRLVVTGTFVMAALPKIKDPVAFAISVDAFQVVGPTLSNWIALFLPWLELILGIGILLPQIRSSSSILIAVLLIVFISLHASAWIRGLEISCGCFGTESAGESTNYLWLIIRNTLLLAACILVILKDRKHNYTIKN
jgi:putative oxidoreductase